MRSLDDNWKHRVPLFEAIYYHTIALWHVSTLFQFLSGILDLQPVCQINNAVIFNELLPFVWWYQIVPDYIFSLVAIVTTQNPTRHFLWPTGFYGRRMGQKVCYRA